MRDGVLPKRRRVGSVRSQLILKSREAALTAVQVFNNPLTKFKSESFIVLMTIAWTYLMHAYYRGEGIEYRYFQVKGSRRRFDRTKTGHFKYWELERCLNDAKSPIDRASASNLRFLIGLRHEIEHQMTLGLDNYLGGRYQACALNYNHYLKQLLGAKFGIDDDLRYTIQFAKFTEDQMEDLSEADLPDRVREYIADFDGNMEPDDFNDERYSYRLLFTKKLVNHPGQADRVVEFIKPDSDLAKTISQEYWVRKEVEKPKFLPKQIVSDMREAGFPRFNMASHVALWQSKDAKDRSKGYGTMVAGHWYWYERWRDVVRAHCEESGDLYRVKE